MQFVIFFPIRLLIFFPILTLNKERNKLLIQKSYLNCFFLMLSSTGRVELDGELAKISVQWHLTLSQSTYIGFGPDTQMKCKWTTVKFWKHAWY